MKLSMKMFLNTTNVLMAESSMRSEKFPQQWEYYREPMVRDYSNAE